MRYHHYTVRSKDVQEHAAGLIENHLPLTDYSTTCTVAVMLHVLFTAAARLISVSAACADLQQAPSDETMRKAVLATLPQYAQLQQDVNRALVGDLPKPLRKREQRLAIDLHL